MSVHPHTPGKPLNQGVTVCLKDLLKLQHGVGKRGVRKPKQVGTLSAGESRSLFKGRGIDFEEVRRYQAGDDIRYMDWRVTARSGIPHLKVFREERERPVLFIMDFTPSMFFGTKVAFKSVAAARAAALLAWTAVKRRDRVGALVFSGHDHRELRPQGGRSGVIRFLQLLVDFHQWGYEQALQSSTANASGAFSSALARAMKIARPGSLVYVMSDFRPLSDEAESSFLRLGARQDLMALFLYDRLEADSPPPGRYRLTDGAQTFGVLDSRYPEFVKRYSDQFNHRQHRIQSLCAKSGGRFVTLATHEPVDEALRYELAGERRPRMNSAGPLAHVT